MQSSGAAQTRQRALRPGCSRNEDVFHFSPQRSPRRGTLAASKADITALASEVSAPSRSGLGGRQGCCVMLAPEPSFCPPSLVLEQVGGAPGGVAQARSSAPLVQSEPKSNISHVPHHDDAGF